MVGCENWRGRTGGSAASVSASPLSNLDAFLAAATPAVPSRTLRKSSFQDHPSVLCYAADKKDDEVEFFLLEDLWNEYAEMSAYGLQVPIQLETGQTIFQFYVPYLSALQIYTNAGKPRTSSSRSRILLPFLSMSVTMTTMLSAWCCFSRFEESESDSSSDDSSSEKLSLSWDSASDDSGNDVIAKGVGKPAVHFVDWSSPYERVPLADKIYELAQEHACLMTLKSVELSPASWMSIAWYPIYHIPANYPRGASKDISACFLTYHTISSLFQDGAVEETKGSHIGRTDRSRCITLSPFGLATYRMQGTLWMGKRPSGATRSEMLRSAAESWLKQLGVHHPDFNFFTTRSA